MSSTMRKSTQLQNVGAIAAQEVYKALNIEPTNRRNPEQTQVRAAIGTVLRSYMSDTNTSKVLGRDRSTVCYYVRSQYENKIQNLKEERDRLISSPSSQ